MIALIAEKPSVAKDIALIIGATQRNDGYLSGNGYMVTWTFGHLIQLAMPEAYGVANFRRESLPILPPDFQLILRQVKAEKGYKADPGVLKQLRVIKEVFDQCDRIIVATDAGREGELIFRYIFHYLNCRKPFVSLWISSLIDKAIREGLENLQPYVTVYHRIRLAATRRSQYKTGTERVYNIYPAIIPFLLIVEPGRQIYRILVLDKPCFPLETFVFRVKDIIHEVVFQQPGHPRTRYEHTDIAHRQRGDIKHGVRRMWQRKFQQPPVQEEQSYSRHKAAMYLRPRYFFLFHALSADARQGEEHHRKKFRPKGGRKHPGRALEVPQYLVYHPKCHSTFFQGGVTEPVHVYSHE